MDHYNVRPYPRRIKYTPGMRFFNFVILAQYPSKRTAAGRLYTQWKCLCDCGKEFVTTTKQIQKGVRKSCGCKSISNYYKKVHGEECLSRVKYNHYRGGAKERNIKWDLDESEFFRLIKQDCFYCGTPPCLLIKKHGYSLFLNGVDRIDSSRGYASNNVVPCCHICNRAKGTLTQGEFLDWIRRLKNG